ncbi:MAG: DUF3047 domain-containing protein [Alcanivorax sp.]|nr:DUF3047 domain-containing protein [Alcanivorax sp.]
MNTTTLCDRLVQCIPLLLLLSSSSWANGTDAMLPSGWREVVFHGHTRYQKTAACWQATAHGSASGLVRERSVSLQDRPWLHWQWRAAQLPTWPDRDERQKDGDDFLARVYVIHKGFFPWQTRAINYVWSRQQPLGRDWPNPFASQAHMVVVQGPGGAGQWHAFSRNVARDFQRYFQLSVNKVQAVAIMTDTDNTGASARACYRLPRFSRDR